MSVRNGRHLSKRRMRDFFFGGFTKKPPGNYRLSFFSSFRVTEKVIKKSALEPSSKLSVQFPLVGVTFPYLPPFGWSTEGKGGRTGMRHLCPLYPATHPLLLLLPRSLLKPSHVHRPDPVDFHLTRPAQRTFLHREANTSEQRFPTLPMA